MKKIVSIIGSSRVEVGSLQGQLAYDCGRLLVDNGYRVQTGGLGGVMSAAMEGAKNSSMYTGGDTIAILPSNQRCGNQYADIVISTGLDVMRNGIVINTDAVIVIGGGAGTLCETALAWSLFKLIVAFDNVDGWSSKLADTKIDERVRYSCITDDRIYGVRTPEQAIILINEHITKYTRIHSNIR